MSVIKQMLCLVVIAVSLVAPAYAQGSLESPVSTVTRFPAPATSVNFDIPAQPLTSALSEFARQSGQQLLFSPEIVTGKIAGPVQGSMLPLDALDQLLIGSGLIRTLTPSGAILINGADYSGGPNGPKADGSDGSEGAIPEASAVGVANAAAGNVEISERGGIEEIIVTGQKKEERIQDVPIAISAFSMEQLDNQKIEGGFDLLKAIPNVTFTKSNFTGYNFQIRGIGTQAISATTDPGVAVSFNNTTLIVNRLFEQEYLDIERVEVLRGPQGTLFGRNATAGVVNVISAKPEMGVAHGEFKLEGGNYGSQRFRGYFNTPLLNSDTLALRAAFAMTKRDGYGTNLAASDPDIQDFIRTNNRDPVSNDIDNRDLWTGRLSLGWQPTDRIRANLIYERFEEDDQRMRSTKQLCHFDDGEVTLYDPAGNPVELRDAIKVGESERNIQTRYRSQLTQGCLPKSLFDKGDPLSGNHGAYATPNGNAIPFVRAARGGVFVINNASNPFPHDPTCVGTGEAIVSNCVLDPLATPGGQSRDLRAIFSMIEPRYEAMSELIEGSFDVDLSDGLTLSSQTVYMTNELFSTQDFLRFKTLPMFNSSKNAGFSGANNFSHRRGFFLNGVFSDPQLGPSDRLLMQDVSQQDTRQFSQELRLVSDFEGPLNFSFGANYTRFETVTDYFVFINMLSALVYGGEVYAGVPGLPKSGALNHLGIGLWGEGGGILNDMAVGCGTRMAQIEKDIYGNDVIATCVYVQDGSIEDVRHNPEGHNFFLSRNPYELNAASIFSEIYYEFSPTLKLTAGLRFNWDRKTFTPVPSQTMLADWRGRIEGGDLTVSPQQPLGSDANLSLLCDPRLRYLNGGHVGLGQVPCATGGLAENGRGYPSLPDMVQEWRAPTGRIGLDWKVDIGFTDETLLYAFYTRGYKAGGANPPTQSAPSGLLLAAAQGAAAPPVFKAEYVNALELGTKNRLFGGAVTLNGTAFYYDYTDYQISKIVDRSANNENIDASVWGLELEAVFAPAVDTLLNASVGYLRTRIADGEQSLDLMDRTQGGNHSYVDPTWAGVDCSGTANANHLACMYPDGFDQWVLVRPTLTQASSCIAPAVLVYNEIKAITGSGTMGEDRLSKFCPGGELTIQSPQLQPGYSPFTSAPNSGAGFLADVGGHELPNAPRFTISLGAQHTSWLPGGNWSATGRVDWYWQDESYHRIYNTEYDRLQDWTNTNLSFWVANDRLGLTIEAYVKNVFNDSPITGAFLNSDDTGLSTNVFTLDPRLIGLSIRKRF